MPDFFISGDTLMETHKCNPITTGCKGLDKILGGGVKTREVTEVYGEFAAGKSQLAFQLSVNVQLPPERGGLCGKTIYIDTENTFSPTRIVSMATALGLDPKVALSNIRLARVKDVQEQIAVTDQAIEMVKMYPDEYKLLVVDSTTAHFRAEFLGRATLAVRQQTLNKYLHKLVALAESGDIAIYLTNQVLARPDQFLDPIDAVGGNVLKHAAHVRMYLRKGKKGARIARIVDSPSLPEQQAPFLVTENGIIDFED